MFRLHNFLLYNHIWRNTRFPLCSKRREAKNRSTYPSSYSFTLKCVENRMFFPFSVSGVKRCGGVRNRTRTCDLLCVRVIRRVSTRSTPYIWFCYVYPTSIYGGREVHRIHNIHACDSWLHPGCTRFEHV